MSVSPSLASVDCLFLASVSQVSVFQVSVFQVSVWESVGHFFLESVFSPQAWACLFGALLLALIIGTRLFYPDDAGLTRYDFLFLAALAIQIVMLATRLETLDEAKVILIYHIVGTIMEVFKTYAS